MSSDNRDREFQAWMQLEVPGGKQTFPSWMICCYLIATTFRADWLAFQFKRLVMVPIGNQFRTVKKVAEPGSMAGTFGSAVALILLMILDWNWYTVSIGIAVSFLVGIMVIPAAASYLYVTIGEDVRHDGTKTDFDYNQICWDEVHGQFISSLSVFLFLSFVRPLSSHEQLFFLFTSFVFFRIFDAWKDPFVKWVENRFALAFGVMLDDTAAGFEGFALNALALGIYGLYF